MKRAAKPSVTPCPWEVRRRYFVVPEWAKVGGFETANAEHIRTLHPPDNSPAFKLSHLTTRLYPVSLRGFARFLLHRAR